MNTILEIQNVRFEHKTKEIKLAQKHILQIQNLKHHNVAEVKKNG